MRACLLLAALLTAVTSQADARIVAFGDVHGANKGLVTLLRANKIIDAQDQWIAGDATLISLGDLVDRGPGSRAVMDLLMRLQNEARAASGEVVVLLGNHEAMNLTGELRDVSREEFAAFASEPLPEGSAADPGKPPGYAQLKHALSPGGYYGSWLLQQPTIAVRGNTAFMHGGLATPINRADLEQTNRDVIHAIVQITSASDERAEQLTPVPELLGSNGPLWYRGTASCHELLEAERLQSALAALNVDRLVVGHTPTPSGQPESRFDGAVITLDTGMLTQVYGGQPYLLEIRSENISALDSSGTASPILQRSAVRIGSDSLEQAFAQELAQLWSDVSLNVDADNRTVIKKDGRSLTVEFIRASKQKTRRAIAAWRLDRHLGFDFVPLTLAVSVNGRAGYAQISHGQWRTEVERQLEGRQAPNYCAAGHVFNLVTMSDALLRATPRSADELSYSRRSWDIRLGGHENSFGRRSGVELTPAQADIPAGLRQRLEAWTQGSVNAITEGQLSKSDVRALLARRDALLKLDAREPISGSSTP